MGFELLSRYKMVSVALVFFGIMALLPFNNCSTNPQNAPTPQTAFMNPAQQMESLKAEFKERTPLSFCQSSEAYGCSKKIYSSEVLNGQTLPHQECSSLADGVKLCPSVQPIHFNSEAAQENCNGCEETYEYMEYSCHLKIPNQDNVYPIYFTEPTLDQSLFKLYQFCASIAEVPQ